MNAVQAQPTSRISIEHVCVFHYHVTHIKLTNLPYFAVNRLKYFLIFAASPDSQTLYDLLLKCLLFAAL